MAFNLKLVRNTSIFQLFDDILDSIIDNKAKVSILNISMDVRSKTGIQNW